MIEDPEVEFRAHNRLLDAVGRLHKTQYIKKAIRNEPSSKRSEFDLVKTKSEDKRSVQQTTLAVPNLVTVLRKSNKLGNVSKDLKNSLRNKKVLKKPLEKPVVERINRSISYEKAKKKLNRWNAVVATNRATDHISFPLRKQNSSMEIYVSPHTDASNFRIKSELMIEMEKNEPKTEVPDEDIEDLTKLTREEIIARSKELRLIRIRESQKSAKARLQKKIKSKKFHKIMKKEKLKEQIKQFQLLQKTDPEAAIRKLDQLEKHRIEERALLRHKNTGTWAKNLQIRAKYDKDARKELAQQLSISRELTQNNRDRNDDDDNDLMEEYDDNVKDDQTNNLNPWVKTTHAADENASTDNSVNGYRKYWNTRNENEKALKDFRSSDQKKQLIKGWLIEECHEPYSRSQPKSIANEDALDDIFDEAEEKLNTKVTQKFQELENNLAKDFTPKEHNVVRLKASHANLNFKKKHLKPSLDEELNATQLKEESSNQEYNEVRSISSARLSNQSANSNEVGNINPEEFLKTKKIHLKTTLPSIEEDQDDETDICAEKQLTIAEAFEDDDILNDFQQENADENEKKKSHDIDLTLPGWGSWGGCGIKPRSKKLIIKFPREHKRRDENKGHVIIVDELNNGLRKHQVSTLPFPFTSVQDYEAAIRAPVGREFVPEIAHNLLTKPAVTTQLGTIIDPIDKDVLLERPSTRRNTTARRIAAMEKSNV